MQYYLRNRLSTHKRAKTIHQMTKETTHQINSRMSSDSSRFRNAARAAPLSGRHIPNQYMSPLDTRHLITPAEFETKYVAGKAGNRYTDNEDIVEIPERVSGNSVVRPNTPSTPVTATQRSDTATSVGSGTTYRDEDDHVSTGW